MSRERADGSIGGAPELKSPSEAGEIERRISPRTKLDGGWDKLHFQRAEREDSEGES